MVDVSDKPSTARQAIAEGLVRMDPATRDLALAGTGAKGDVMAVAELAGNLKLKGAQAWCSVAGHSVFTRFVKLPPVGGDKVDQIVEFEARQNVPFPINEVSWDYEFVSADDAFEKEVVLVAMKSDSLNELNDQVAAAGIMTSGMDLAPTAIYNAFRYSYPEVDEPAVIIDLGARSTNLIFSDGGRMFTRNILVGGAAVTGAVAKEFGLGFGDAEQQKVSQGFVSLGGGFEDHADPGIAALSKVIRNSMTRLHGEVLRTINYYRSQQGGNAPQRIFLCGGGAQLGYVTEFFQEKFKLPVEIFNPLRGVQLGSGVKADAAAADAHLMGELVGLALRVVGACPVEVELVPDAVATARDAAKRAPALIMAGLCLWGLLGASIIYVRQADKAVKGKTAEIQGKYETLQDHAADIASLNAKLEDLKQQSAQIEEAVNDRSYWVRMLADLNNRFENDFLWLTQIEPLKDGKAISPRLIETADVSIGDPTLGSLFPVPEDASASTTAPAAGAPESKLELRLLGLYRKNDEGQEVVYRYARALAGSEFFDIENIKERLNDYCKAETGVGEDRYAYKFEIRLPLKQPMQFKK
jgi:type IV pilus assembly protein PilM